MQETATRATLSPEWQASRKLLDWMHVPGMAEYVNKLVSGRDLNDGGHWAVYANQRHVTPLATRLGRPLTVITLGSGDCHIEASLIRDFGWPINKIICMEYDEQLRKVAVNNITKLSVEVEDMFLDFNNPGECAYKADLVFCCHAIHHAENLEAFLPFVNSLMGPESLFVGIEYFGPSRFQAELEVRSILKELDSILPSELKYDLRREEPMPQDLRLATIKEVRDADISEAARSSDLRTLLFSNFPVEEIKPMGGTLLRWLYQYRAGNFDPANPLHVSIAGFLIYIEKMAIEARCIKSDDLFFVCRRSELI